MPRRKYYSSDYTLTHSLLIVNILIFFIVLLSSNKVYVFDNFAYSLSTFIQGNFWNPVSSMFLHGNIAHLILNMLSLFFFGRALEPEITRGKYIAIYIIGGIIANFGSSLFNSPDQLAVGASGAIFALIAAAMIIKPFDFVAFPYVIPIPVIFVAAIMIISNIILFFAPPEGSNISFIAHIIGFGVGLIFGFKEKGMKRSLIIVIVAIMLFLIASQYLQALNIFNYTNLLKDFVS